MSKQFRQYKIYPLQSPYTNIWTICGSMRFYNEMLQIAQFQTSQGIVILMPFVTNAIGIEKEKLDALHKQKIDMSNGIIIVNIQDYIGESTRNELEYALTCLKRVQYVVNPHCNICHTRNNVTYDLRLHCFMCNVCLELQ